MANRRRGEIEAELGGQRYTLCLTLGALAELEDVFKVSDLATLGEQLGTGRINARALIRIVGASLRGAGHVISDEEVAAMPVGGVDHWTHTVAELLLVTFSSEEASRSASANP